MKLFILLSVSVACAIFSSASAYPRKSRIQRPYLPQLDYIEIDREPARDDEIDGSKNRAIRIDDEDEWDDEGILRPRIGHPQRIDSYENDEDDDNWSNDGDDWEDESDEENNFDDDDEDEYYEKEDRNGIDQFKPYLRYPPKTHLDENEWLLRDTQNNQQRPPFSAPWHRLKRRALKIR